MKLILKHRSISEMLTSVLLPSPVVDGDGAKSDSHFASVFGTGTTCAGLGLVTG